MSAIGSTRSEADAEKVQAAKRHVVESIIDIIIKNFDDAGSKLETQGTFTALLEAYKAIEIAEQYIPRSQTQPTFGSYGSKNSR